MCRDSAAVEELVDLAIALLDEGEARPSSRTP